VRYACSFMVAAILLGGYCQVQQSAAVQAPKADPAPEEIIRRFAAKEAEFYEAWMQYTYTQTASIRILSVDGAPQKEEMTLVSEVVFNDDGTREVRSVRRAGSLRSVMFTTEDMEVINNINPFALTTKELPLYNLKYQGQEKVDELDCYVFSVTPKSTRGGRLYFSGKIWVDDQDLQVVRTMGKAVPQTKENQFPEFETVRQRIDNKYWFPAWTHADSKLRFPEQTVRVEETITFGDYRRFTSRATILFGSPNARDSK